MNSRIFVLFVLILVAFNSYSQKITVDNDFSSSGKKGYFNWKVYLKGHPDSLKEVKEVVYTLHPSFPKPEQTVKASPSNKNFSYGSAGWGEFDIKVKVVFIKKRPPLYLMHHLKLSAKKG